MHPWDVTSAPYHPFGTCAKLLVRWRSTRIDIEYLVSNNLHNKKYIYGKSEFTQQLPINLAWPAKWRIYIDTHVNNHWKENIREKSIQNFVKMTRIMCFECLKYLKYQNKLWKMHSWFIIPKISLPEIQLGTTFAHKQSKEHQHIQHVIPIF